MNFYQPPPTPEMLERVKGYRRLEDLIPAHWSEGEIMANDIRQHYYRTGGECSKPAVLLLHGFSESGLTWLRVARELERDYDVIMVDARGHGHSEGTAKGYSPKLLVEDAASFICALKLDRPRVIGFSMGGGTALGLATAYPELIRSFVYEGWTDQSKLKDAASSEGYQIWFKSWIAWLEKMKAAGHTERLVSTLPQVSMFMAGSVWPEEEYVPTAEAYAQFDLDLAKYSINLWSQEHQINADELLKRVTCPALIMKHDFEFPMPGVQPKFREVPSDQPNVLVVHFEKTGHMIHRSAFDQFMGLVIEFFKEH